VQLTCRKAHFQILERDYPQVARMAHKQPMLEAGHGWPTLPPWLRSTSSPA
jgi:hypothetical protein